MLDIYICEDNGSHQNFVSSLVSDYCTNRNLDAAVALSSSSPAEILKQCKNAQNPARFFLDIDLKAEINGIELASRIREQGKKASIVFLIAHSELAFLTFQYKVEALDFIIKDNQNNIKNKVTECIEIAIKRLAGRDKTKRVEINIDDKIILLDMEEIIYIETTHVKHKLRLHTRSRVLEFDSELKKIEEKLDKRFIRCHKSYIINRDMIVAINKKESTITMINNISCPISRNGKKLL